MKKQLLTGALALGISFGAIAEWTINENRVPVVSEHTSSSKILGLMGVCERELPVLVLGDLDLPDSSHGNQLEFKARIDKGTIYPITAAINELSPQLNGFYIEVTGATFKELLNGDDIRFQFKNQAGDLFVERYSLKGVTLAYQGALALCGSEFFDNDTPEGQYF